MRLHLATACSAAALMAAASSAHAATACSAPALNALQIPDVNVTDAKPMPATGLTPAFCQVTGTVVTRGDGAPDGSARFLMQLPDAWKQRFVFFGVGGNAGTLGASVNQTDRASALGKGYVTVLTDTGHVGDGTTAKWSRKPDGSVDQAKLTDFFFRAAHDVGVAGKAFAAAYYAAPILHAYFDGCSTGGRMALVEAEHYPDDYAGIIAGDPAMDYNLQLHRLATQKAALTHPGSFMSAELLAALDKRVTARCDAIDGAKDGLVQDPAKCPVKPKDLACKKGEADDCLNPAQVALLTSYVTPLKNRRGKVIYPGWPITDLAGDGGSISYTFGKTAPNLAEILAPWGDQKNAPRAWALGYETLANYLGDGPSVDTTKVEVEVPSNVASDRVLSRVELFSEGDAYDVSRMDAFVKKGGKLVLYHGASDPSIPAARTLSFYQQLAERNGGYAKTQASVRFFLAPGMHHCGGGPGPDRFDTLTALENWVEQGQAPATISASSRPDSPVQHHIPLCPYPQQARYDGKGDVTAESSWTCKVPAASAKAKTASKKAA